MHETLEVGQSFKLPDRGIWEKVRDDWAKIEDYAKESGKQFICESQINKTKSGLWWEFTIKRVR